MIVLHAKIDRRILNGGRNISDAVKHRYEISRVRRKTVHRSPPDPQGATTAGRGGKGAGRQAPDGEATGGQWGVTTEAVFVVYFAEQLCKFLGCFSTVEGRKSESQNGTCL